ncbi:glycosyltransferase [Tautonia sociabilis]|uniref:Glycosyltransferase n=1 Tax=Tautonia sociabilis TaxID=2080755 RepID=A0A432MLJ2_9BACT|nr:glycosyltransferase [Tautonia sociabilis]RUL88150.1 glycosyltransferase [Tautonia sociabilis]
MTASPTTLPGPSRRSHTPSGTASGWVHLCNGLDPVRDGGMVPSILGMTGALAGRGDRVEIVTPTPSRRDAFELPAGLTLRGPEADLASAVRGAEVVHIHGLWQGHSRRGAAAARRYDVPYLIAAHGMAEPWALRQKALKKRIYTALIEGPNLRGASCLHALSRPEIGHLRALAPEATVCFVPNGVDLSPFDDLPPRAELEAEHPELAGKFLLLFLGRLHPKKGLDLLAEAMGALGPDHPELHLLLAGNDDGALSPFLGRMAALELSDRVTRLGHVAGPSARRAWGAADAFILPSYSEGFSMAVLEALAARLPSLITTACHFPELARAGGGLVVEPDVPAVTAGLRELLERSPDERADLGRRGRELVEQHYTWDRQADRLAEVYRYLSGGGPRPEAIASADDPGAA